MEEIDQMLDQWIHNSIIRAKLRELITKQIRTKSDNRIVLDEMVDTFTTEMIKQHHEYDLDGKKPIITKEYWLSMIAEVQSKIDGFTTVKALKHSNKYR